MDIFASSSVCPIRDVCGIKAKIYRIERRVVKTNTFPIESRSSFRVITSPTARKWPSQPKDIGSDGSCAHPGGCSVSRDSGVGQSPDGNNDSSRRSSNRRSSGHSPSSGSGSFVRGSAITVSAMSFADDVNLALQSHDGQGLNSVLGMADVARDMSDAVSNDAEAGQDGNVNDDAVGSFGGGDDASDTACGGSSTAH